MRLDAGMNLTDLQLAARFLKHGHDRVTNRTELPPTVGCDTSRKPPTRSVLPRAAVRETLEEGRRLMV